MKNAINLIFGLTVGFLLAMLNIPDYPYIELINFIGAVFVFWTAVYSFKNMEDDAKGDKDD